MWQLWCCCAPWWKPQHFNWADGSMSLLHVTQCSTNLAGHPQCLILGDLQYLSWLWASTITLAASFNSLPVQATLCLEGLSVWAPQWASLPRGISMVWLLRTCEIMRCVCILSSLTVLQLWERARRWHLQSSCPCDEASTQVPSMSF